MSAQAVGQLDGSDFAPSDEAKKSEPGTVRLVPLDKIKLSGENMRLDAGDIEELAASIAKDGLLQPLVVEPYGGGHYRLICGHRRLAACRRNEWTTVPCSLQTFTSDIARLEAMFAENLHRRRLSPLEEARAIKRLVDEGVTQYEVAERIGKSQFFINQRLTLLALPESVQMMVHAGEMSLNEAVEKRRKPRGDRGPEPRDTAKRWQIFYIDKLLGWIEGGSVGLHLPEFAKRLNLLRDALNALAGDTSAGRIKTQDRLCKHPGCKTKLSRYNAFDYCGPHEHLHR